MPVDAFITTQDRTAISYLMKPLADQMQRTFRYCGVYLAVVPSYIGGFMALTWVSQDAILGDPAKWAGLENAFAASLSVAPAFFSWLALAGERRRRRAAGEERGDDRRRHFDAAVLGL